VLVPVFGLILTAASVWASVMQYLAADLQAQAAEAQLAPHIFVRADVRGEWLDAGLFMPGSEVQTVEISSQGGPIHNYAVEYITELFVADRDSTDMVLRIPVNRYFQEGPVDRARGQIRMLQNGPLGTYMNMRAHPSHKNWRPLAPWTLVKLSYVNAWGREVTDFYSIGVENHWGNRNFRPDLGDWQWAGNARKLGSATGASAWDAAQRRRKVLRRVYDFVHFQVQEHPVSALIAAGQEGGKTPERLSLPE
jgi:hypothetical protein